MTGWNLPPGINECDIPGNRPEDEVCDRCERGATCDCHWSECPLGKFDME